MTLTDTNSERSTAAAQVSELVHEALLQVAPARSAADALGRLLAEPITTDELVQLRSSIAAIVERWAGEQIGLTHASVAAQSARVLNDLLAGYLSAKAATVEPDRASIRRQVLETLRDEGSVTPSTIADRVGRTRPQVSRTLTSLTAQGMVRTSDVASVDGRSRYYELTPAGREALERESPEE